MTFILLVILEGLVTTHRFDSMAACQSAERMVIKYAEVYKLHHVTLCMPSK